MSDKKDLNELEVKDYEKLIKEIKEALPNIVLPSMGIFEEIGHLDINSKEFFMNNKEV